jgi:hypothetical protein
MEDELDVRRGRKKTIQHPVTKTLLWNKLSHQGRYSEVEVTGVRAGFSVGSLG